MISPVRSALAALILSASAFGLNPIHEGSYALWPRLASRSELRGEIGVIIPSGGDGVEIPLGLSFKPAASLELGLGVKTAWGEGSDHIPYVPLGLKYKLGGPTALNLDFLLATRGGDHGLRLGMVHRSGRGRFSSRLSGQLGFLPAFVNGDAFLALEGEWMPSLRLTRAVSIECGLAASSQTDRFDDNFALDLEPGLFVGLGGDGGVLMSVAIGLAGHHMESVRVKAAWAEGF